ncbi:hypothetical protein FHH43_11010 [Clostridium perfringens]|nr:hypothetical protein [Clostridium perfringens]
MNQGMSGGFGSILMMIGMFLIVFSIEYFLIKLFKEFNSSNKKVLKVLSKRFAKDQISKEE